MWAGPAWSKNSRSVSSAPSCIAFGDGGAAKSYIAPKLSADLAACGLRVGYFDWELSGEDHRERLERLCPGELPDIRYVRCDRPLVFEADRLRRIERQSF